MKKSLLLTISVFSYIGMSAQKMAEPEYIGQVNYVNADSTTTLMETEPASMNTKNSGLSFVPVAGMFLGKGQAFIAVKGTKSMTKLPAKGIKFLVRVKDNEEDPKGQVGIIKFDVKKKERRYLMAEAGLVSGVKDKISLNDFKYDVKRYGQKSYLIEVGNLKPGEYAITTGDHKRLATFSVE